MMRCLIGYVVMWHDLKMGRVKVRECVRLSTAEEIIRNLTLRGFESKIHALDAYGQESSCDV
jgi:hypothetical protein